MKEPLTAQEAFAKAVLHLRRQGAKSIKADGSGCAYRGAGGMSCAVGCLIDDDDYSPAMEGECVFALRFHGLWDGITDGNYKVLEQLQSVHDATSVAKWEEGFEWIAKSCGLELPPLEAVSAAGQRG